MDRAAVADPPRGRKRGPTAIVVDGTRTHTGAGVGWRCAVQQGADLRR